ncbi:hypothetical protein ACTXT7_000766 [Hymenolepis weldensis]
MPNHPVPLNCQLHCTPESKFREVSEYAYSIKPAVPLGSESSDLRKAVVYRWPLGIYYKTPTWFLLGFLVAATLPHRKFTTRDDRKNSTRKSKDVTFGGEINMSECR